MFIKDKTKKYKSDIFNTQNWNYDEINDEFICPNNKRLGFLKDMPIVMISMVISETSNYMNVMIVQNVSEKSMYELQFKNKQKIMKIITGNILNPKLTKSFSEPETKKYLQSKKIDVEPVLDL